MPAPEDRNIPIAVAHIAGEGGNSSDISECRPDSSVERTEIAASKESLVEITDTNTLSNR